MLLSAITVIGAAMDWHVRTKYSGVFQYPCLQLFVVAPSASGKGAITHTRRLAFPIHRDRLEHYPQAKAEHLVSMNEWNEKIRQGKAEPEPQPPAKELFLIPGNNTGTGILQNIIDSHGNGLIFEVEADTVSTAIAGDYGHWSDTLRKAFDHDSLSYNRRTDREYRDLRSVRLGVVLSGTPQQVPPMIPSAENGLFSRHVFYYIPRGKKWLNQFDDQESTDDNTSFFDSLAERFMEIRKDIFSRGVIELRLTDEQKEAFNDHFSHFFRQGQTALGGELDSTVIRQAINALRVMSVVAVLREFDKRGGGGLRRDNWSTPVPDGSRHELCLVDVTDDDFLMVLGMFEKLYQHSIHILSFVESSETQRRVLAGPMLLLNLMPDKFKRKEWVDEAAGNGIKEWTAVSWLKMLKKKGSVVPDDKTQGYYIKVIKEK